jgi:hypothetical protein
MLSGMEWGKECQQMQMDNHHYLGHGATFHLHSLGFQTHPTPPSPHPSSGSGQIPKICTTRPEQISCTEQVFCTLHIIFDLYMYSQNYLAKPRYPISPKNVQNRIIIYCPEL